MACRIRPDDEMPIDEFGNRADMALHGTSVISRLIGAQLYELYINAASRDVSNDIREMLNNGERDKAWQFLVDYYNIVSPSEMGANVEKVYHNELLQDEHLGEIVEDGIRIIKSLDSTDINPETYKKLREFRPPNKGIVTLTDYDGNKHQTTVPMYIGEIALLVLEKSATKPQAECVARLQNNGLPASATVSTRDTRPVKRNAGRCLGETEVRSLSAIGDSALYPAEIMELATCPEVSTSAVETMFTAEDPSNIPYLVDRRKIPLGRSRSIGFFNHLLSCAGARLETQDISKVK